MKRDSREEGKRNKKWQQWLRIELNMRAMKRV